jgi:prolyl oligopeptidase
VRAHAVTLALLAGLAASALSQDGPGVKESGLAYPRARRVEQVDVYGATKVEDPYRWLEDLESDDTKAWVASENAVTAKWFKRIRPLRSAIRKRTMQLGLTEYSMPEKAGDLYFYMTMPHNHDMTVAWVTTTLSAPGRVLLDMGKLSQRGPVALGAHAVSDDGRYFAYGLAKAGSDWVEWRVKDVETGKNLPDRLKWIRQSVPSWTHDGKGFYYARYDEPKTKSDAAFFNKLYYHRLRTSQDEDTLVLESREHKEWDFATEVTDDGRYLVVFVTHGTGGKRRILYQDLEKKDAPITELFPSFDDAWALLGNDGTSFYWKTDKGAPRKRIVKVSLDRPSRLVDVVPESDEPIADASIVGHEIFVTYFHDAHTVVRRFSLLGKPRGEVELPGLGTVEGFWGRMDDSETFYSWRSFTTPSTIYRYDMTDGTSTVWQQPRTDLDPRRYVTEEVFVTSRDGTKIPLWIMKKRGASGPSPTILYGYGGFNISLTPEYAWPAIVWIDRGGVYCVANLRGGGEYGEAWHQAGTKEKKQNVFDDFMACASYLERNEIATPAELGIMGGSNGGLLVGACLVQHPELFGGAVADVGVMDMLRFHKFTGGWEWIDEFGSPDDPKMFPSLRSISPYHNVKRAVYPPTLITTGDNDDRVVPSHSFKFAAALQAAQRGSAPVLLRVEENSGHGEHNSSMKEIEKCIDQIAFLAESLRGWR